MVHKTSNGSYLNNKMLSLRRHTGMKIAGTNEKGMYETFSRATKNEQKAGQKV